MQGSFNANTWYVMMAAIVAAIITKAYGAVVATFRPAIGADGLALDPVMAAAWRGRPTGRELEHHPGDLHVSHFLSMHAPQALPLTAAARAWTPWSRPIRGTILGTVTAAITLVAVWTLRQAFTGRPPTWQPSTVG